MRSVIVIMLHAYTAAQFHRAANSVHDLLSFRRKPSPVHALPNRLYGVGPRVVKELEARMLGASISIPGPSQLKKLARRAIDVHSHGSRARNVLMSAAREEAEDGTKEIKDELLKMDNETQAMVATMGEAVALRAHEMAGVTMPLGFFDPLGFSTNCPEGKLLFYREVELKHGRVGMLASLGILVAEQWHPLWGGDIDVPSYIAFQQTPLQTFWPAVLIAIGIPEIVSVFTFNDPTRSVFSMFGGVDPNSLFWTIRPDHEPGNLGFDPLGLKPSSPEDLKEMQTKELNNGRLAMIAAAGMIAQELASGKKLFELMDVAAP